MLDPPSMPTEQSPESNQSMVVSPAPAFEVVGPVGSAPPGKTKPARRRRLWLWLLILLLLGLGAYFLWRSEEHTSELQSLRHLVGRLLLEKKFTLLPRRGSFRPRRPQEAARWRRECH